MGWLDVVGLAVDAKIASDLYRQRRQFEEMHKGVINKALFDEIIGMLRNFVFSTTQTIREMSVQVENSPHVVYTRAKVLEKMFYDLHVSPEVFPDFSDKEYVQKTWESLQSLIHRASGKLEAAQIGQAEECAAAVLEMSLLEQTIQVQEAREYLVSTESKWKHLSGKRTGALDGGIVLLLIGGCLCLTLPLGFGMAGMALSGLSDTAQIIILGLGGVLLLAIPIVGFALLIRAARVRGYHELNGARKKWYEQVRDFELWEEAMRTFGKRSSEGYRQLRVQRETLIRQVLGTTDGILPAQQSIPQQGRQ